jgi:hypothetical protein
MLIQKRQMSIALIILGAVLLNSGTSANLRELDSIGRLPEIDVTAQRYEYQDEAWLGMVEGVVVEAQRPAIDRSGTTALVEQNGIGSGKVSPAGVKSTSMHLGGSVYLSILIAVTFVMLSTIYISLRAYLATEEIDHDRTEH